MAAIMDCHQSVAGRIEHVAAPRISIGVQHPAYQTHHRVDHDCDRRGHEVSQRRGSQGHANVDRNGRVSNHRSEGEQISRRGGGIEKEDSETDMDYPVESSSGLHVDGKAGAGQDAVLTGALNTYLDACVRRWDTLAKENVATIKDGLTEFKTKPLRFGWIDDVFRVIRSSTSFVADSAGDFRASVVQQDLPTALDRADASTTGERATTPAHLCVAGWRTAWASTRSGTTSRGRCCRFSVRGWAGRRGVPRAVGERRPNRRPAEVARQPRHHRLAGGDASGGAHGESGAERGGTRRGSRSVLRIYMAAPPPPEMLAELVSELWGLRRPARGGTAGS